MASAQRTGEQAGTVPTGQAAGRVSGQAGGGVSGQAGGGVSGAQAAGQAGGVQPVAGEPVAGGAGAGGAVAGEPVAGGAEAIRAASARIAAAGESRPRPGRDPVNLPMIRNWAEALGDANPVYTDPEAAARSVHGGLVAPPAMAQVWTMGGLHPDPAARDGDPLQAMSSVLDEAGFTSVVATNCEQSYHRYLRPGDQVSVRSVLESVAGPKRTALGEGWFVTTRSTWYVAAQPVATMLFRILKYRPAVRPAPAAAAASRPSGTASREEPAPAPAAPVTSHPGRAAAVLRPVVSPDTAFFWAGTAAGELRIQRCGGCGVLRHPPGPRCPACATFASSPPGYVVAAGTGEVYSYVVHHHPPVPGRQLPIVIALVTLTEGVRIVGELIGTAPERARIGLPVRVAFVPVDEGLTLPAWREDQVPAAGITLPELVVEASTTFVVASALATRDFQDVHHDRDAAIARGSQDIFVNILTTTGLVQRFVTDWAGPQALVRGVAVRLGVPCYAGDTLTFSGEAVAAVPGEAVPAEAGSRGSVPGEAVRAGALPALPVPALPVPALPVPALPVPALPVPAVPGPAVPGPAGTRPQSSQEPDGGTEYLVRVIGRGRLGDHVTGTVRVLVPGEPS